MKLEEAISDGLPLAVRLADGAERTAASMFVVPTGVWLAEVFWLTDDKSPFHHLGGAVSGDGPWQVGAAEIRVIGHGDPCHAEWSLWKEYLRTPAGKLCTADAAWREIKKSAL